MNEIDLIQANYGAINLAYTTSTWWLTISTALVVATYFAGKHIPRWLFVIALVLYAITAISVLWELNLYSNLAISYSSQLVALDASKGLPSRFEVGWNGGIVNSVANYAVVFLGSLAAAAYSFVVWRAARHAAELEKNRFQRERHRDA